MTRKKTAEKYKEVYEYMTTPVGLTLAGKRAYPTLFEASVKFDYNPQHISRIMRKMRQIMQPIQEENGTTA